MKRKCAISPTIHSMNQSAEWTNSKYMLLFFYVPTDINHNDYARTRLSSKANTERFRSSESKDLYSFLFFFFLIFFFSFSSEGSLFLVSHRTFYISAEIAGLWKYIIVRMSIKSWQSTLTTSEWRTDTSVQTAQELLIRKITINSLMQWKVNRILQDLKKSVIQSKPILSFIRNTRISTHIWS